MDLTYSNASGETGQSRPTLATATPWLITIAGLASLYTPSFWDLFHGLWAGDQQGHGPIVLGIALWMLWKKHGELMALPRQPRTGAGWALLAFGLLLYLVGRSQNILIFEVGSIVPMTASVLMLLSGLSLIHI